MALDKCVQILVCGLGAGLQRTIKGIINAEVAVLEAEITALQAEVSKIDVLSAPIQALNTIAQDAIAEIRSKANIVPVDLLSDCLDFGSINGALKTSLDLSLRHVNVISNDLSRLLSLKAEINSQIAYVKQQKDIFLEVLDLLDGCDDLTR